MHSQLSSRLNRPTLPLFEKANGDIERQTYDRNCEFKAVHARNLEVKLAIQTQAQIRNELYARQSALLPFLLHQAAHWKMRVDLTILAHSRAPPCSAVAWRSRRTAFFLTASVLCTPCLHAQAAQNEAVLRQLEKIKDDQTSQEIASPGLTRLRRIQVWLWLPALTSV